MEEKKNQLRPFEFFLKESVFNLFTSINPLINLSKSNPKKLIINHYTTIIIFFKKKPNFQMNHNFLSKSLKTVFLCGFRFDFDKESLAC